MVGVVVMVEVDETKMLNRLTVVDGWWLMVGVDDGRKNMLRLRF